MAWRRVKKAADIAVLHVPFRLEEVFEYAKESAPKDGDPIVGLGISSEGATNLVTQCMAGKILANQARAAVSPPFTVTTHDLPPRHGDSGGPVVSLEGQLLGINVLRAAWDPVESPFAGAVVLAGGTS